MPASSPDLAQLQRGRARLAHLVASGEHCHLGLAVHPAVAQGKESCDSTTATHTIVGQGRGGSEQVCTCDTQASPHTALTPPPSLLRWQGCRPPPRQRAAQQSAQSPPAPCRCPPGNNEGDGGAVIAQYACVKLLPLPSLPLLVVRGARPAFPPVFQPSCASHLPHIVPRRHLFDDAHALGAASIRPQKCCVLNLHNCTRKRAAFYSLRVA